MMKKVLQGIFFVKISKTTQETQNPEPRNQRIHGFTVSYFAPNKSKSMSRVWSLLNKDRNGWSKGMLERTECSYEGGKQKD
jgi:hypothetical protein